MIGKFRRDVIISTQVDQGRDIVVVKDPGSGRYFRFGQVEHFILERLDGNTSLEDIRLAAQAAFDAELDRDTIVGFVDKLDGLGLMERPDAAGVSRPVHPPRHGRVRGSTLYLRVKAFDPDRLLGWMVGVMGFCFTRWFVGLMGLVVVTAIGITMIHAEAIRWELVGLYNAQSLVLLWGMVLLVTAAHEFAHGLTCKWFGGQVREMGFLLIYFQPALYCNVSDAWLFPEKSKRLWVTFSGAFFELVVWGLATVAWRLTAEGTLLNFMSLVVMAGSGLKVLLNMNPLIKLDGYYLLSDYLEIPNLRAKASKYIGANFKRLLWYPVPQEIRETPRRHKKVYLTYGVLAVTYSILLLGFIAMKFGQFMVERYQGLGFVLFISLVAFVLRSMIKKMIPQLIRRFFAAVLKPLKNKRAVVGLIVFGLLFVVGMWGQMELKVSGEFQTLPAENAPVRARVAAIVHAVHVSEGDKVEPGQLLVELVDGDYTTELAKVEAQIDQEQSKLKIIRLGPQQEEIDLARSQIQTAQTKRREYTKQLSEAKLMHGEQVSVAKILVAKAKERLQFAKNDLETLTGLFDRHAVSAREIERANEEVAVRMKDLEEAQVNLQMVLADNLANTRAALAVAEEEIEEAQSRLILLQAGNRPEQIEVAEAAIKELEARRKHVANQIGLLMVKSPIQGRVVTRKLDEKIGELVEKGDLIVEVQRLSTLTAELPVSEKEIADIQVGQPVVLKARAYPGRSFHGKVTSIATSATQENERLTETQIIVTTELNNSLGLLKPGMTGHAKILCGQRRMLDVWGRRIVRYFKVEFWSWW